MPRWTRGPAASRNTSNRSTVQKAWNDSRHRKVPTDDGFSSLSFIVSKWWERISQPSTVASL